ncbi:MAG: hypothetical protein E7051_09535 [Lentisphaerae bacterium]|nr:hypothetical protein [Lentisphaerota bacterium]
MKFAPRVPLWGRNSPDPLVPAKPCAKTDRGGVQRSPQLLMWTALLLLEICHCSNIRFEQWIFLPCKLYKQIYFKLKKAAAKQQFFAHDSVFS